MRVFLTGATGFIGQPLVRAMCARNWEITALVRNVDSEPSRWLATRNVTLVQGDVTRPEGLRESMAGADVVVHNAGVYELGPDRALRRRMQEVNVQGTANVLEAALEAGIRRTVYVSSTMALGCTGPEPSLTNESQRHSGRYVIPYERSKAEAHQVALGYRERGLGLVIAIPNGVVGPNDHSLFGYLLRMYLLGILMPVSFARDVVYALTEVDALAEGLCLAAERAPIGQDYLFCGEPITFGEMFTRFGGFPGGMVPRWYWARSLVRPSMALMEPVLRALRLPAFLSRDTVDISRVHFNYSSAKAQRDLGWNHPPSDELWPRLITRERELVSRRSGFLGRLRHQSVVVD